MVNLPCVGEGLSYLLWAIAVSDTKFNTITQVHANEYVHQSYKHSSVCICGYVDSLG